MSDRVLNTDFYSTAIWNLEHVRSNQLVEKKTFPTPFWVSLIFNEDVSFIDGYIPIELAMRYNKIKKIY